MKLYIVEIWRGPDTWIPCDAFVKFFDAVVFSKYRIEPEGCVRIREKQI